MQWNPAPTAPFDRDLELAVIKYDGPHTLAFPCRRILGGWINAETKERIADLHPTHWRAWHDPPLALRSWPLGPVSDQRR
jgi:hypothetical protein